MNETAPKFHEWFHKFLIYFAMWALPLAFVIEGVRLIVFADENGAENKILVIILSVLLILAGLFCVKVRFDLAAFRRIAIKEFLWVCLAAAACIFLIIFILEQGGAIDDMSKAWIGLIIAAWGVAVYRYYSARLYLFKD